MSWWVYKCNNQQHPHQVAWGDWDDFFHDNRVQQWGSTEWVPALAKLSPGDIIVAYQTDRNELVGIAEVVRLRRRGDFLDLHLRPGDTIREKVRPLKQRDPRIAAISAFQPGPIMTVYPIDDDDARALLNATGTSHVVPTSTKNRNKYTYEEKFLEGEERSATSRVRNPKLRAAAKIKWGTKCYCCGFDFKEFYGDIAAGCAVVHHLKPFASSVPRRRKTTVDDVRVVCANCHYVIHLTDPPLDVEDLRKIVAASWGRWAPKDIKRAP